jgi:diaminopimelate decarboxylase
MTPLPRYLLPDTAATAADGESMVGGCRLTDLAREFGTPLFVYDEEHIRNRARAALRGFGDGNVIYAAKAFLCKAMARLVHEEGLRIDVASGGEMEVALAAGVPPSLLVFHGNNKSRQELAAALDRGVGRIVVDSFDEIDRIESLVGAGSSPAHVLLRITPGVEAHTHEYIATGQEDTKFGFAISSGAADEAVKRVGGSEAFVLHGLHAHIGSQVFRIESFAEAGRVIARFAAPHGLPELVLGGGLGVAYVEVERTPDLMEWADAIRQATAGLTGATIAVEPGRALVAGAAITLYTVGTVKDLPGVRTYVAVDGGMSDNPRPVLYGSGYETFLPRAVGAERTRPIRLVGKHCESGDLLVRDGLVPPDLQVGDIIATPVTGAYGHSMGSNYNKVPRPPVVFVAGGRARLVVRRETVDDLMATDVG